MTIPADFNCYPYILAGRPVLVQKSFDGGSSTSLYLGGELLDRPIETAAAVHNDIKLFCLALR